MALGSTAANKAVGNDGIQEVLFKILKDNAIQVLHSISQQIWKTKQWPQDWKRSILILVLKKGGTRECANLTIGQLHSSPMLVKIRLRSCMLAFSIK